MSGTRARGGFRFQDLALLHRLIDDFERERVAQLDGAVPPTTARYRLERPLNESDQAGAENPGWDLIELRDSCVIVDECKSGGTLRTGDREKLWRRVRRTVKSSAQYRVVVRLTVSEAMSNRHHWENWDRTPLDRAYAASWRDEDVRSTESAVAEAWFYLTSESEPGEPVAPPLAKRLLETLIVEVLPATDELEESVVASIARLTNEDVASHLSAWVETMVTRLAMSPSVDVDVGTFGRELGFATNIFSIEPEVLRVWKTIRGDAVMDSVQMSSGLLPTQSWREVQPSVAATLDAAQDRRFRKMLLIGRGGLGKSTLLVQLGRERAASDIVVWVDDETPSDRLQAAILLGTWLAEYRAQRLLVLIDQLDEVEGGTRGALINAAVSGARTCARAMVVATARDATASRVADGWERVQLAEWSIDVVCRVSQREVPADLGDLLGVPLLLALWLEFVDGHQEPREFGQAGRRRELAQLIAAG